MLVLLQCVFMVWRLYSSSVRGDICALSSSDDVLAPLAVWCSCSMGFLCLGYLVTGRYSTTVQDTANLTELAYSRLNVTDPLGWDVLDALEASVGLSPEVWWHHRLHW